MVVAAICSQRRRAFLATALTVAALASANLHAATSWTAGVGDWSDSSNWNTGTPSSTIGAIIENGGTAQVLMPDAQSGQLVLRRGSLEVLQGGSLQTGWSLLGQSNSNGAVASATVDGAGTQWTLSGELELGHFGPGTLTVSNGGYVQGTNGVTLGYGIGGEGMATVTGADSSLTTNLLQVGDGNGTSGLLTIADGATVDSRYTVIGQFGGSSGVVLVTGPDSSWQTGVVEVGRSGHASVTIADGGHATTSSAYIGQYGGNGAVLVTGPSSEWSIANSLVLVGGAAVEIRDGAHVEVGNTTNVGPRPNAHITLQNGTLTTRSLFASPNSLRGQGTIYAQGLVGDVTLQFDAAHGLQQALHFDEATDQDVTLHLDITGNAAVGVGRAGQGLLTIADGAKLPSLGGFLGMEEGSHGVALITGDGSEWASPAIGFTFGTNGTGELNVSEGGALATRSLLLGDNQTGHGTVHIAGLLSTLAVAEQLRLGRDGTGELSIEQGATVTSGSGWIAGDVPTPRGAPVPGVGNVTIAGAGSKWNIAGNLVVCYDGVANLTVSDGAQLWNREAVVGQQVGADGHVTISGPNSQWNSFLLKIGDAGAAVVAVNDGARLAATQTIAIGARGRLTGDGFVDGDLTNGGVVAPGVSTGTLHLEGRYTQLGGGELQIDIASPSQFDALEVAENASFKGRLAVSLVDGFMPSLNDAFPIVTSATNIFGKFISLSLPSLAPGLAWEIEYAQTAITLRVGDLTADFNHDGVVNGDDLAIWKNAMTGGPAADANSDGQTDGADFLLWQRQFSGASPAPMTAATVPEPATFAILLPVAIFFYRRRNLI